VALDYYTGERIDGTITAIPLENPQNKTTANITNGEWSFGFNTNKYTTEVRNGEWNMSFDIMTEDVEHLVFVVESGDKKGYNELKLPTPSAAKLNCTTQNTSLSGYSVDTTGKPITSGNVRVSILDTDYTNTTTFSSGTWGIDLYPCLVSGQVYTIQILISDNTGKRGEILQKYPAK
jgi:hypothetical protein